MPNDILESVKDFNTITIFRHVFADMDAIGSQFGLKYYLESAYPNKKIYCLGNDCPVSQRNNVHMDVVDDEVGAGGGGGYVVPVSGDAVGGQVEVDGRDGCDGIDAAFFGMGSQLNGIGGVVAGHVGDDGQLAAHLGHDVLQHHLALGHALVDALAGGAAHIHALDALGDQVAGQGLDALGGDRAVRCVAGVESRNNTAVFGNVFHTNTPFNNVSLIVVR